jgi:O-antigen/teichoic acid export membrane protein
VIDGELALVNRALVLGDVCRTLCIVGLFVAGGLTVETAIAAYAVLLLVPWAIAWRALGGRRGLRRPRSGLVREQLSAGARLSPHFLFLTLNLRLDVLLVAALAGAREVGLYSVAVLVAELVWVPTWALAQATKAAQAGADQPDAARLTARAARMTLLMSGVCGAVLALAAPLGLGIVFGSDFDAALTALWLLLPAAAAMALWRQLIVFLARVAPPRVTSGIAVGALVVNCSLNLLLIPPLGIAGAALASVGGYGCGALLALWRFMAATGLPWRELLPRRADLRELFDLLRPRTLRRRLGDLRPIADA